MSYYTKYRPQTIANLDLMAVKTELSKILTSGKFSHAYLFSGFKGTGKTSSARILAKILNCQKNTSSLNEPCNTCDSCRSITLGNSLNCLEIDAASNRGIDDIRTLKERITLTPINGRYTVYIIDEVHMLTTEAFNALLKTLEEPPAHAVFILCTTEINKIPATIISRCTQISFYPGNLTEIIGSLTKVAQAEKLDIQENALHLIAQRSGGSFRDAVKMLEQVSHNGTAITPNLVNASTGYSEDYQVAPLIDALITRQLTKALTIFHHQVDQGIDILFYTKRLVEAIREHLINSLLTTPPTPSPLSVSSWLSLATLFSDTAIKVKQAVLPPLPLEIAIVTWCKQNLTQISQSQITNPAPILKDIQKIKIIPEIKPLTSVYPGSLADIKAQWANILTTVKPLNHSLEALLKSTRLVSYEKGYLTIEAFYKFHQEQLTQDRYRQKLEEEISKFIKGKILLKIVLGHKTKTDPQIENISGKVEDDDLVKAAEEIFK